MKRVAFLIPSTSKNRDWASFSESYLNKILFPSITKLSNNYDIEVYIGYDRIDPLFSAIELPKHYNNIVVKWFPFSEEYQGKPTHIWNKLADGLESF